MFLSRKKKKWIIISLTCLLLVTLIVWQPVSFAWLSEAIRNNTFTVKSSDVSKMDAELWINAYEDANDWTKGWYVDTIQTVGTTDTAKKYPSIGTFGTNNTTFTPASPIALHFGTINNLVQEQENIPIYLKFSITLKPKTNNTVILSYKTDETSVGEKYLSLYQIDLDQAKDTTTNTYMGEKVTDTDIMNELNDESNYPFLRFHYFVSTSNYSFAPGVPDLSAVSVDNSATNTVDFDELFYGDDVVEYVISDTSTHSIPCDNNTTGTQKTYIYVKINVRPDTLSNALTELDLAKYIPCYLLFAVVLGVEIQTSAYRAPVETTT